MMKMHIVNVEFEADDVVKEFATMDDLNKFIDFVEEYGVEINEEQYTVTEKVYNLDSDAIMIFIEK